MDSLTEAVQSGASPDELAAQPLPRDFPALYLSAADQDMFRGVAAPDVRTSLRLGRVAMPDLAPDEVLVAVMASSINYNTIWSALFQPVSTFGFLRRFARQGRWEARHSLPYHVIGSDAAAVIVRVGDGVRRWAIGDHVVVSPTYADDQEPATHADGMLGAEQRVWGFETNFGGLAHYAVVRASQLVRKPAHLTWEEAACVPLCAGTGYRMLVSDRGARFKQGDIVLIWGATGGLGSYAVQLVRSGGGIAVGVVGSEAKAAALRELGCDLVIQRDELGISPAAGDDPAAAIDSGRRLGAAIRAAFGEDPHVVFDYVGRATIPIALVVARRGGTVVTCGSSTGYDHRYDNRYLWMKLKRIVGSHAANLQEMAECVRLVDLGRLQPTMSGVYPLQDAPEAARLVQNNGHLGKLAVLCMAPQPGLGVTNPTRRAELGEATINPLRMPVRV